jgi:phage-related minor tail protein
MQPMERQDELDQLDAGVSALERTMSDTAAVASAFDGQLRGVQQTLGDTVRDLGNLERGFSGGLRRAFDGLVFDGLKLSDALGVVAKSMVDTVYAAAVNPVTQHFGGLLADGVNAAVSGLMPFADGAPFSQGRVMPFAKGGVVGGPVSFPMRGGMGLMGEAGAEAIMPLQRGPDGRLGVRAQGGSGTNITMNITTPDAQSFQRSQGQIAAQMTRALGRGQRNR